MDEKLKQIDRDLIDLENALLYELQRLQLLNEDAVYSEIDPAILTNADVYVDAIESAVKYGAPSRALAKGLISKADLGEIGCLIGGETKSQANTTVACLSGLGVQDLTAVNGFWHKLARSR